MARKATRHTRRAFLKASGLSGAGAVILPRVASAATVDSPSRSLVDSSAGRWPGSSAGSLPDKARRMHASMARSSSSSPSAGSAEYFLQPDSTFFSTAFLEYSASLATSSDGDLWPTAWADDGNLYGADGDGTGFGDPTRADIVVSRIMGTPETGISGQYLAEGAAVANVWADPSEYNRKPTGMVAVDGNGDGRDELYLAVQDLRYSPAADAFNDVPNASISVSTDYGVTWTKTSAPMFSDYVFTTIFFLDYGQSQSEARVLGPSGADYVYAYGLDNNWRTSYSATVPNPVDLYLARVPRGSITQRQTWEFFAGLGQGGQPTWASDIDQRSAVLHDARTIYPSLFSGAVGPTDLSVIAQGGVVYVPQLRRYLYTSWTEFTFEFYEAPAPWGPWKLFMTKDAGCYPWFGTGGACAGPKNGGYAATIPSKFISPDGCELWVQSNWFVNDACGTNDYDFSLRRLRLFPRPNWARATNRPDSGNNLAMTGQGVATIEKSAHYGHGVYYNDGVTNESEDSWDGSNKPFDFWGYTWDVPYRFNQVVYTSGNMFPDGGWFASGLTVQVRNGADWSEVPSLGVSPAYPYDNSAGPNNTYTLSFDPVEGDGVRIYGAPGGEHNFTSVGELEVYFTE